MGCPSVRGDNPGALASGLSYVQVDKTGITIYTTYISVDLAHHEIFRAKVGMGGIKSSITPDPVHLNNTQENVIYKRGPRGQPFPNRLPQGCNKQ